MNYKDYKEAGQATKIMKCLNILSYPFRPHLQEHAKYISQVAENEKVNNFQAEIQKNILNVFRHVTLTQQ